MRSTHLAMRAPELHKTVSSLEWACSLLLIGCSLLPRSVLAQTRDKDPTPRVVAQAAEAKPMPSDAQLDVLRAQARQSYATGVSSFKGGDFARAREQFAAADEAYSSPNIKLMLARSLVRLDHLIQAHTVFRAGLREAVESHDAKYDLSGKAAEEELQALLRRLVILNLRVDDPSGQALLSVAGSAVPREQWGEPIAAMPGTIEIALSSADGRRDVKTLKMSAGSSARLAMALPEKRSSLPPTAAPIQPPPASPRPTPTGRSSDALRPISYAAAGVGVAGIVAFGVLGALSNREHSELADACPDRSRCDAQFKHHADDGQRYQSLANVSLGIGIAALAAGVVLWIVSAPDPSEQPRASLSYRGAALAGSF